MKVVFGGREVASMSVASDKKTGECTLTARGMGYEATIPGIKVEMSKSEAGDLVADVSFQDILGASIVVEQGDIKSAKDLMNKSVLGFMIKSLM